ncbi:MAG: hypothetical protein ACO3EK_18340, partial [Alphaproteobacteria bacterium]
MKMHHADDPAEAGGEATPASGAPRRRSRQRRFLAWAGAGALALIAGGVLHLARAGAPHPDGADPGAARDDHALVPSSLARTDVPAQVQGRGAVG